MSINYYINPYGNVWANNITVGYPLSYNTTSSLDVNGNINCNGSLAINTSSATPITITSSSNNPSYNFYTTTNTGTSLVIGNTTSSSNVGWNYNGGVPYGYIYISGATINITYSSTGIYIGTLQGPPNSGTYAFQVDGGILLNGSITTNNYSINAGTGSITCSNIITNGINTLTGTNYIQNTSGAALIIWDGITVDTTSVYGTLQIGRNDNLNRSHLAFIRGGNYVWQFGYINNGTYTSNFGIFPWNFNSGGVPLLCCNANGTVSINTTSTTGYNLNVNGNIICNTLTLQNNPQIPCIMLASNAALTTPSSTVTNVLFQTSLTNSPFNGLGITYSNGTFTNTSGITITVNVSASVTWASGVIQQKVLLLITSANAIRLCQHNSYTTTTTQIITQTINANIVLTAGRTFNIQAFSNGANSSLLSGATITIR